MSKRLGDAIRAIVDDQMSGPPEKKEKGLDLISLIFLGLLVFDVSMTVWILQKFFSHPLIRLMLTVGPVLGITIATYKSSLQKFLVSMSAKGWFRVLTAVLAVVVVLPAVITVNLPLDLDDQRLIVMVDSSTVTKTRLKEGVYTVPVRGFREHLLKIRGVDAQDAERTDVYHLSRKDLLSALFWPNSRPLSVGLLVPVGVTTDRDSLVQTITVEGVFPKLFLRDLQAPFENVIPLEGGISRLSLTPQTGVDVQTFDIPPGKYTIQYVASNCVSPQVSFEALAKTMTTVDLKCSK